MAKTITMTIIIERVKNALGVARNILINLERDISLITIQNNNTTCYLHHKWNQLPQHPYL